MPNWITNKVEAPREVLESLLNAEGRIDFNTIIPFMGTFDWNGIDCAAEEVAEVITAQPLNDHPLIASLQRDSRTKVNALKLSDEGFEQFVQMLRNKRQHGYFHSMDFARDQWGTKWNACNQAVNLDAQEFEFETAWSCPRPIYKALSAKFPDATIIVRFADEDIGSNCGTIAWKGGEVSTEDVAGNWNEMIEKDRDRWSAFARDLTGRPADDEDDE